MSAEELEVVPESTALTISVKGEVLTSNFPEFEKFVIARIESVNVDLKTPKDVEQGKKDAKELKAFVADLNDKKDQALKEMDQVYTLLQAVSKLEDLADEKRIAIDKAVKESAAKIKQALIDKGISALELDTPANRQAVEKATFRKSSPESMGKAIDDVVDALNLAYQRNSKAIAECKAEHGEAVCYDEKVLLSMPGEMLIIELERRIERHRAEVEKARLKAELEAEKKSVADEKARVAAKVAANSELPVKEDVTSSSAVTEANTVSGNHLDKRVLPSADDSSEAGNMTAEQEWKHFITVVPAVFIQFRQLRLALKHEGNQAKALTMAKAVNEAFIEMKGGA